MIQNKNIFLLSSVFLSLFFLGYFFFIKDKLGEWENTKSQEHTLQQKLTAGKQVISNSSLKFVPVDTQHADELLEWIGHQAEINHLSLENIRVVSEDHIHVELSGNYEAWLAWMSAIHQYVLPMVPVYFLLEKEGNGKLHSVIELQIFFFSPKGSQHFSYEEARSRNPFDEKTSVLNSESISDIHLQNVTLEDALQTLAKYLHVDLMIPVSLNDMVNLNVNKQEAKEAFELLLLSHGLIKRSMGKVWLISPQTLLIKEQQENLQLQNSEEASEPLVTKVWQIRYAKADDIAQLLQDSHGISFLSKRAHIKVDSRTNMLGIQEIASQIDQLNHFIRRFDVPARQVLIKARLASIDNDFERTLGITFETEETQEKGKYGIAIAKLVDGTLLDVKLSALENEGHGELISSPSLFTANQQTASIESGEEIPYQETSRNGGTSVAFKKAVLSLEVTPQILPGNKILLQLKVNQDRPSNRIVLGVPAINTRQMSTQVVIRNGDTIVLGGIYEIDEEQNMQRIPFLGKIPLIGMLFEQKNHRANKRELLIFVTPHIIEQRDDE